MRMLIRLLLHRRWGLVSAAPIRSDRADATVTTAPWGRNRLATNLENLQFSGSNVSA